MVLPVIGYGVFNRTLRISKTVTMSDVHGFYRAYSPSTGSVVASKIQDGGLSPYRGIYLPDILLAVMNASGPSDRRWANKRTNRYVLT